MPDATDARVADVLRQPYHWIIQPGEDGYAASVLEFPGCLSGGATPEDAVSELQDAIVTWVSGELEAGHEIPEAIDPEHSSGRLTFRIPPSLHYRAQLRAEVEGVSLNRLLSDAVSLYMGDGDTTERAVILVRELIGANLQGVALGDVEPGEPSKVVDLMAALRASVEATKSPTPASSRGDGQARTKRS